MEDLAELFTLDIDDGYIIRLEIWPKDSQLEKNVHCCDQILIHPGDFDGTKRRQTRRMERLLNSYKKTPVNELNRPTMLIREELDTHRAELDAYDVSVDSLREDVAEIARLRYADRITLDETSIAFLRHQMANGRLFAEMDARLHASTTEMSEIREQNERLRLEVVALVDASNKNKRKRDDRDVALDGPTRECSACKSHKSVYSFEYDKKKGVATRRVCNKCRCEQYRISKKANVSK